MADIDWSALLTDLAGVFRAHSSNSATSNSAPSPAAPSTATIPATATKATGAEVAVGIGAILPALTKIQSVMASAQFKQAEVGAEDFLKVLAVFNVPGAAAVEEGIEIAAGVVPDVVGAAQLTVPILAKVLPVWLGSGGNPFAPAVNMHPVGQAGSKPTGIA